jgi:hypothetical protein
VGVFTSLRLFFPTRLVDSTLMDEAPVDARPYFPGIKVGKKFISIVPF